MKDADPRMHSAEHILTGALVKRYNCGRPFTTHLERKKSKADYHFDRPLSDEEIRQIDQQVNEVIESDVSVREEYLSRAEAARRFDLGRLPEEVGDTIRIVHIGDFDQCPCSGNHVRTTKEIGAFRIISASQENGALRIRFKLNAP